MRKVIELTKLLLALTILLFVSKIVGVNTDDQKEDGSTLLGIDFSNQIDIVHAEVGCSGSNGCGGGCAAGCGCGASEGNGACCETGCGCGCASSGDCFLTTVVVERMGEADDGATLTAMRYLRDEVMLKNPIYAGMVEEYYEIAPPIAKRLETAPMNEITTLYQRILQTRFEVEQKDYVQAIRTYKQIVDDLSVAT